MMINVSNLFRATSIGMLSAVMLAACSDDSDSLSDLGGLVPEEQVFGKEKIKMNRLIKY